MQTRLDTNYKYIAYLFIKRITIKQLGVSFQISVPKTPIINSTKWTSVSQKHLFLEKFAPTHS